MKLLILFGSGEPIRFNISGSSREMVFVFYHVINIQKSIYFCIMMYGHTLH